MSEELDVLKEVTGRLERAGIAYMVTGSMAANFYTVPRMTRDIDIVVELAEEELDRFISFFEGDFYLDPQTVLDAVKHRGMFNLIQNQYIVKIDFIVRKDIPYRRREFSRRKRVVVDNRNLYLVAPEDLILSKLEWAKESRSQMQLSDVRNLLSSVKRLDRRYLARWRRNWASNRFTVRCASERHASRDRTKVSSVANEAFRRGAFENGMFDACDGPGAGQSRTVTEISRRSPGRIKALALSTHLRR